MANQKVSIVARVKQDGKRKWVKHEGGTPAGPFYLRYCQGSTPHYIHAGDTIEDARAMKRALERRLRLGLKLESEPESERERVTTGDAAKQYLLEIQAHKAEATWVKYSHDLGLFTSFCKKYLDEISRADLLDFITHLRGLKAKGRKQYGAHSIHDMIVNVSTFLKAVGVPTLLKRNDAPKYAQPIVKFYSQDKLSSLLAACKDENGDGDEREHLLILFLLVTGFRRDEVRHAEFSDVDWVGKVIRVQDKPRLGWHTKTWEQREVPVTDSLIEALRKVEPVGFIFKSEQGGMTAKNDLYKVVKRIAARQGVEADLHTFRRTFGTMWSQKVPLQVVQKYMGHKNLLTTMRYLGVSDVRTKATRKAVEEVYAEVEA
jgi:integrase